MIVLLSPTKQMDFETALPPVAGGLSISVPDFAEEARVLRSRLSTFSKEQLAVLMSISPALAQKTSDDIRNGISGAVTNRPAIFAYSGTVFTALDPRSLNKADLEWAQNHMRILSGLYGMLRPLDEIHPYRLEMKCPLPLDTGESLAAWWKDRITGNIPVDESIVSLASAEYIRAVDRKRLGDRLINLSFKERRGGDRGSLRTVGMYAKVARGLMLRRIIREKPVDAEYLKSGETGGYHFSEEHSRPGDWIFIRDEDQ